MSALDDLLLKKYRESLEKPSLALGIPTSGYQGPTATGYVSSGSVGRAERDVQSTSQKSAIAEAVSTPDENSAEVTAASHNPSDDTQHAEPAHAAEVPTLVDEAPQEELPSNNAVTDFVREILYASGDVVNEPVTVAASPQRGTAKEHVLADDLPDASLPTMETRQSEVSESDVPNSPIAAADDTQEAIATDACPLPVARMEPETNNVATTENKVSSEIETAPEREIEGASLETPEDLESRHSIPLRTFKPEWEIDRFPWPSICEDLEQHLDDQLSEAVRQIRNGCEAQDCKTVFVTSARSGAGRTTMTLCLAREAARQGLSVAIVDLDHAEPSILDTIGVDFEQGIESLGTTGVSAETICVKAVDDQVSLLPTAAAFHLSHCVSPETQELLRTAAAFHDMVFVDASREVVDRFAGSRDLPAQAVLMVTEPGIQEATQAFVEWLHERDTRTLGIIENFAA